jgi:hypothetical protein
MANIQDKQNDWKNREIGALWKKAGANGKSSFCTGYIVSDELGNKIKQRVIMFSNKSKTNEKSPDFVIYLSNEQENEGSQAAPQRAAAAPRSAPRSAPTNKAPQPVAANQNDDEIPDL